jgi:hypothetical protein
VIDCIAEYRADETGVHCFAVLLVLSLLMPAQSVWAPIWLIICRLCLAFVDPIQFGLILSRPAAIAGASKTCRVNWRPHLRLDSAATQSGFSCILIGLRNSSRRETRRG